MKRHIRFYSPVIYVLLLVCTALTMVTLFCDRRLFLISAAIFLVGILFVLARTRKINGDIHKFLSAMSESLAAADQSVLAAFPLPTMGVRDDYEIVWYNDMLRTAVLGEEDRYGDSLREIFPLIDFSLACPPHGVECDWQGRKYTVYYTASPHLGEKMFLCYFLDDTELKDIAAKYYRTRPGLAIILVDNYDELVQSAKENERSQILSELGQAIEKYCRSYNGFIRQLEKDRYLAIFEEEDLSEMIDDRFSILEEARRIAASDTMTATLSIGVARGCDSFPELDNMAQQALDMSLGRGGDQAAVKTENGFVFFGGVSKGVEKRTKVKTRIVAGALSELIQSSSNVILMGHRFADLDAFGSAVGMDRAVRQMGKESLIAIDPERNTVGELLARVRQDGSHRIVAPAQALEYIQEDTLLIVVDTHSPSFMESETIYRRCKTVVVIDHHRKVVGHVENAIVFFHEPYASSASEMVTELIQYLSGNIRLSKLDAEALMAGIMLDTKNFTIKTGVRTFEAAAYLRRMGADTVEVRKMFSTSMDVYQRKSRIVASAEFYRNCAIAVAPVEYEDIQIEAAQAADELLGISGVDASFVLYDRDGTVNISARSMGAVNVQIIMEYLGGGGHLNMAACQLEIQSFENAKQMLLEAIDRYEEGLSHKNNGKA